jgi:hypothetical protein
MEPILPDREAVIERLRRAAVLMNVDGFTSRASEVLGGAQRVLRDSKLVGPNPTALACSSRLPRIFENRVLEERGSGAANSMAASTALEAGLARMQRILGGKEPYDYSCFGFMSPAIQSPAHEHRPPARPGGVPTEPATPETTANDGPDPDGSTGTPRRGPGTQSPPVTPVGVDAGPPKAQDSPNPQTTVPKRKRDGSKSDAVMDYLVGHLKSYNESMESKYNYPPLPSQREIAKLLGVSEATVSRVVDGWLKKYRNEIRAEMVPGWKSRRTGDLEAHTGL